MEKKLLVGHELPVLRKLKNGLPKVLEPFNKLRSVLKSAQQKNNIDADYKKAYQDFCEFLKDGFPVDVSIAFASQAKGKQNEFQKAREYYEQCKETDQNYVKYLRLKDNNYIFNSSVQKHLESLTAQYVIGNVAIKLYKKVDAFLTEFHKLDRLTDNRVLKHSAELSTAMPLIYHAPDLHLKVDHSEVQRLADQLETAKLDDIEQEVYNEMIGYEAKNQDAKKK